MWWKASSKIFFIAAFLCSACQKAPPSSSPVVDAAIADATLPQAPGLIDAATDSAFTVAPPSTNFDAYVIAVPKSGKPIGHTSVAYKLKFENGLEAAYKPDSKRGRGRYKGEIAAYRLGVALGLSNVPPAMYRSFETSSIQKALHGEGLALFQEEAIVVSGAVNGVLIPWIPKLEFLPLESDTWISKWKGWLSTASVPEESKHLAGQISTLLAFDFVTGNWDRMSGANVGYDKASDTLLFVDNDGAFFDPVPKARNEKQFETLRHTVRFSRSFIAALRGFTEEDAKRVLGETDGNVPLLSANVIRQTIERRGRVLALVEAKIKELGESAVLYFE